MQVVLPYGGGSRYIRNRSRVRLLVVLHLACSSSAIAVQEGVLELCERS